MPLLKKLKQGSLIRTIYLYLFSVLGLVLLIIGSVRFIDMALKAFVFTKADQEERLFFHQPPFPTDKMRTIVEENQETKEVELTEEELNTLTRLVQEYDSWLKRREGIDPVTARRHRDASTNLSLMIVGLPLYLYHWSVIRREVRS